MKLKLELTNEEGVTSTVNPFFAPQLGEIREAMEKAFEVLTDQASATTADYLCGECHLDRADDGLLEIVVQIKSNDGYHVAEFTQPVFHFLDITQDVCALRDHEKGKDWQDVVIEDLNALKALIDEKIESLAP